VIVLPWPPSVLSPNARAHWSKKSRAAKSYRRDCYLLTRAAGVVAPDSARISLIIEFCPPDRRHRDDDNMNAAFKSGRDGIADALGINDSRFVTTVSVGEPVRGGAVIVKVLPFVG